MADYARIGHAIDLVFGSAAGAFLDAYRTNRAGVRAISLDADPVASATLALLANQRTWTGTSTQLLEELSRHVSEIVASSRTWPKSPRAVSDRLMSLAPMLRRQGVSIGRRKSNDRLIEIARCGTGDAT